MSSQVYSDIMKNRKRLAPTWVRFFSYPFVLFGAIALAMTLAVILGYELETSDNIAAYGFSINAGEGDSLYFLALLSSAVFLGGSTGLLIIFKHLWAYRFGIFYCAYTIFVIGFGYQLGIPLEDSGIQAALVLVFFVHLLRHRKLWEGLPNNPVDTVSTTDEI